MKEIEFNSVDLVVTSPPYPMIELWDPLFSKSNPKIEQALNDQDGSYAFELMHQELDKVWNEVYRVIKTGGIVCINVGDAVRTIGKKFQLYPNHSRILSSCQILGFQFLPGVIWRKPTNAPNKFMGSGMFPPSAYVTLEHEFILIFRKGGKREFKKDYEKKNRYESSYFWEERNTWFSDQWNIKGTVQTLDNETRERSAAFPFDMPYRLINMFSVKGDTILDPFLGTGTTMLAAMCSCRNSIGFEVESNFKEIILSRFENIVEDSNQYISERLQRHRNFVQQRLAQGRPLKYINWKYDFPVMTKQEELINFSELVTINQEDDNLFEVLYQD